MIRRILALLVCSAAIYFATGAESTASAQEQLQSPAYGQDWGRAYSTQDWDRLYHYPYVYYPQNFWSNAYYRSANDMYYRYPQEMGIPVYNKKWQNYYPQTRRYHQGHHFTLDIF